MEDFGKPWFLEPKNRAGAVVVDLVAKMYEENKGRRNIARRNLEAYYARPFEQLTGADMVEPDDAQEFSFQIARSICATATAKIASKQRPKPVVLTTGGNYRQRRQAKKKSKFLESVLHQPQGQWANAWDLCEQLHRDCTRWDAGVVKVYGDVDRGKIAYERCYPYDLLSDCYDAEHGAPQTLAHIYRYDRYCLAAKHPEHERAIMTASAFPDMAAARNLARQNDMVAVSEIWRLPLSKNKPGRHIIAVDGVGKPTLLDEEWEHELFPFGILLWEPNPYGMFGAPLVEQVMEIEATVNQFANDLHKNCRMQSGGYIAYDPAAVDEEDVASNDLMKMIKLAPGSNASAALSVNTPAPFHGASMQFLEMLRGLGYETTGVSELSSQGRKEPGIESAVAIRTMNHLQSERFLPQSRAYEQLFVTLGKLTLMAAEDLEKAGVKVKVALVGGDALEEIDYSDVKLPSDQFVVKISAANASEDNLAGRKQAVAELAQAGYISPEVAEEMLMSPNADVEALNKREQAQLRYLEKLISRFQEYEPPEDEEPKEEEEEIDLATDVETDTDDGNPVEPPDPYMDLGKAIIQMTEGYLEAKLDGAPEGVLQLFRDWIDMADKLIAPPPAPTPPPGPPGMPPPGGEMAPVPGMPMAAPGAPPVMSPIAAE